MLPSFFLLLAVVNALVSKNFMPDGPAEAQSTTSLDPDMRFRLQKEVQFLLHHQEPVPSAVENPFLQWHRDEAQKFAEDAPELYGNIVATRAGAVKQDLKPHECVQCVQRKCRQGYVKDFFGSNGLVKSPFEYAVPVPGKEQQQCDTVYEMLCNVAGQGGLGCQNKHDVWGKWVR
eukprot:gnl/MRDRNA2_/MRDRNA2_81459_c0_seq1.p1 gnl/MRDRNA2_/MRDRNA2_81459_c0~~gnl/MRDRNA2_/MRDRNA2_81459_c0_seq1.p1  ORF type:complete len:175 (-),score=38.81 gnl/MRDRNA2_/MRDRNA2_81459_c0_seq1:10-534(-)